MEQGQGTLHRDRGDKAGTEVTGTHRVGTEVTWGRDRSGRDTAQGHRWQ